MVALLSVKSSSSNKAASFGLSGYVRFEERLAVLELDFCDERYGRKNYVGEKLDSVEFAISGLESECDILIRRCEDRVEFKRNHFGRMTLYWCKADSKIYFSTSAIRLADMHNAIVSNAGFYSYSCLSFVAAPLSPFFEINSVPAGASLTFKLSEESEELSASETLEIPWIEEIEHAELSSTLTQQLTDALLLAADRQCSDTANKRVAVFLSGGLDSALTAALLKQRVSNLVAYSLDFGEFGKSELPVAQEIAGYLGIPIVSVRCAPSDVERALLKTVSACDTAFGDGVTVPLYLLSARAAADGCDIAFNGEGGDQLFGGWTNKPLIASTVYEGEPELSRLFQDEAFFQRYMATFHKIYGAESTALSDERIQDSVIDFHPYFETSFDSSCSSSLLHFLRRANLLLKGAQNIQPRASNIAIANGLKLRTLFCDDALAAITFALAPDLLLKGSCEKFILKQCAEKFLPAELVWREKRGMGVPLTQWLLGPLWSFAGKYLNSGRLSQSNYWNKDIAEKLAMGQAHVAWQGRRIGEILWMILFWEAWSSMHSPSSASRYNSFWPPLLFLKVKKGVMEN